jgi:hypothetical protein
MASTQVKFYFIPKEHVANILDWKTQMNTEFCNTLLCFSSGAAHHRRKHGIPSCQIAKAVS